MAIYCEGDDSVGIVADADVVGYSAAAMLSGEWTAAIVGDASACVSED